MVVAFCGHSDYIANKKDERKILDILEQEVGSKDCEFFLGEYGNFDSFCYFCASQYKKTHPQCKLVYVTPYYSVEHQENHLQHQKQRFDYILYPELENTPPRYAIVHRNKWIVEKADILISFITRKYGGAYNAYLHAKKRNRRIFNIADFSVDL